MKRPTFFQRLPLMLISLSLLVLPSTRSAAAAPGDIEWVRQFGSLEPASTSAQAVDANNGNVYVAGSTDGTFPGQTSAGGFSDAFVRKYDAAGNEVWTRQFGTSAWDNVYGIVADASGVYVAGTTSGALPGQANAGVSDAFVRKYDVDGNEVWTRQFGSASSDDVYGIVVADSSVYVAGFTYGTFPDQASIGGVDAFVRKYDLDGNEVWTRQFGTSASDYASGIAADASGVYVAGGTSGAFPGQANAGFVDAFVRKYDASGNEVWTSQFGTAANDGVNGIAADASSVYVTGSTFGTLSGQASAGASDAFVRKYDASGNEVWTSQFGSSAFDYAYGIAADASGIYVTGGTTGALPGQTNAGNYDAFVRKYDASGNEAWTRQFGTSTQSEALGIAVDASGVYVTGYTIGALPGQTSVGWYDAFVRKYDASGNEVWTRQFGVLKPAGVAASGVDSDGNVYVAGATGGALPGQTNAGYDDAFVRKYDASGAEVWTHQFGSPFDDEARAIVVDASGVYVAGYAEGALPGQTNPGYYDTFVRKYDTGGNEIWTRQFGGFSVDAALEIAVSADGVYVAGGREAGDDELFDVVVRQYDLNGNELWTRQFGTPDSQEGVGGIAADASGVYVAGGTSGVLPGQTSEGDSDAFVRKYDTLGNEAWTRQFGTSVSDGASGIAVDASGVYVAGTTYGALPGQTNLGGRDVYVRKYDADGNEAWTQQFGTLASDGVGGVATDTSGVYVTGNTDGALPGQTNAGEFDAFVRQYDADGNEGWTHQFGTSASDGASGIAVDASGVYVAGTTYGALPGQTSAGEGDAFVAKLLFGNTPSGSDITVSPVDGTTLTFANVSSAGQTTVTTSSSAPPLPVEFSLGDPPTFYDISTTATYSPPVTVCITYDPAQYGDPANLHLLHYENDAWVDVPASNDTYNHMVCGQVSSLSPFVVAERAIYDFSGFFQPVDNLPTLNVVKAGSAVPVKFSLGGDQGLSIFDTGYPKSQVIAWDSTDPVDGIEETVSAGSSSLSYDPETNQYTYVWKTDKMWANTCRQLVIKLNDGTYHRANFKFNK